MDQPSFRLGFTNNNNKAQRRSSIGVLISDVNKRAPEATKSVSYTPQESVPALRLNLFPGLPRQFSRSPSTAFFDQSLASTQLISSTLVSNKNRLKAVFIVDSLTNEILIANNNVCRLFNTNDNNLIGKSLTDIFQEESLSKIRRGFEADRLFRFKQKKPLIPKNTIFNDADGLQLINIYGKPIDALDLEGNVITICIWAYPLASKESNKDNELALRKCSAIVFRSPSIFTDEHPIRASFIENAKQTISARSKPEEVQFEEKHHHKLGAQPSPPIPICLENKPTDTTSSFKSFSSAASTLTDEKVDSKMEDSSNDNDPSKVPTGTESSTTPRPPNHDPLTMRKNFRLRWESYGDGETTHNYRWLILMEPISSLHISVILGAKGRIFRADDSFATLLGYESICRLFGTEIYKLLPFIQLDTESNQKEQFCCAVNNKNNGIPLSVIVNSERDHQNLPLSFDVQIRALASINGVITITENGTLYSVNDNFLHELFGYEIGSASKRSFNITDLISNFYENMASDSGVPESSNSSEYGARSRIVTDSSTCETQPSTSSNVAKNLVHQSESVESAENEHENDQEDEVATSTDLSSSGRESSTHSVQNMNSEYFSSDRRTQSAVDTLFQREDEHPQEKIEKIHEGIFVGLAKHVDTSLIPIRFEVRPLDIRSQPSLYTVCINYSRGLDYGISQYESEICEELTVRESSEAADFDAITPHLARFIIGGKEISRSSRFSFGSSFGSKPNLRQSSEGNLSFNVLEDENNESVRGEYSKFYDTFQLIGNGAFGSVKLSARKDTGLLTVTKFINKRKVLPDSWVISKQRGNRMVPIEVHLLETLDHTNIVKVLDVFENDSHYQLVMEKLGCGMDLFEFIENQPRMDEPLTSYIFQQIVSAVAYLHSQHIVHRDLKDENVIIDQNFYCKLIDFGSAAYFGENIVFSTFCGTMEYCAPEVLTGNKYLGPELEMWSLGILLYTLVFFENPFRTAEETVEGEVELPYEVSLDLDRLIFWLLQPNPKYRATIEDVKNYDWINQKVDIKRYKFQELLKSCERAQVSPPLYVSDLTNHLKNASCGNLVSAMSIDIPKTDSGVGIVSAR